MGPVGSRICVICGKLRCTPGPSILQSGLGALRRGAPEAENDESLWHNSALTLKTRRSTGPVSVSQAPGEAKWLKQRLLSLQKKSEDVPQRPSLAVAEQPVNRDHKSLKLSGTGLRNKP